MRLLLLCFVAFFSDYAIGSAGGTVTYVQALSAVAAGSNHTSGNVDMGLRTMGSVQCDWSSVTGTDNATVQVNVSNDGGTNWLAKSSGLISLSGASGSAYLPFNQTPEQLYQLVYTAGTATGGTVSCWVLGK